MSVRMFFPSLRFMRCILCTSKPRSSDLSYPVEDERRSFVEAGGFLRLRYPRRRPGVWRDYYVGRRNDRRRTSSPPWMAAVEGYGV